MKNFARRICPQSVFGGLAQLYDGWVDIAIINEFALPHFHVRDVSKIRENAESF